MKRIQCPKCLSTREVRSFVVARIAQKCYRDDVGNLIGDAYDSNDNDEQWDGPGSCAEFECLNCQNKWLEEVFLEPEAVLDYSI